MITATLPEGELHRAIKTISLFTGSTVPVTKLIRMRIVADQVILTATDGFQATMIRVPADTVSDDGEWWADRRGGGDAYPGVDRSDRARVVDPLPSASEGSSRAIREGVDLGRLTGRGSTVADLHR
ncbi:hypothetical protein SPI1_8 [Skermania phage SPI1]|nr:hypothetical protein SPI1_8 [Skermania phage SPI1]